MEEKKEVQKRYEKLFDVATKARSELEKILKIIGKETDLSSKFLKSKIEALGVNTEIEKKYLQLGKESYSLVVDGKITEKGLKKIADEIDGLYSKLAASKKDMTLLKAEMKKAMPKK